MTRTHDLLITNQLLYRLSYISLSIHDMVFLERHIQNRIYFIIFFDGRQQILLISCHTLCMAIPVYYILYFEGIPSKYFQAISLFPTLFPRIPPITTGNSVVIFPRNFDKFCHYFLLTPFFLQSSVLFSIYIIYLIISFYKELFTFSTELSTSFFFGIINVFRQISPNIRRTANPIFNQMERQKSLYITVLHLSFSTYTQDFLP